MNNDFNHQLDCARKRLSIADQERLQHETERRLRVAIGVLKINAVADSICRSRVSFPCGPCTIKSSARDSVVFQITSHTTFTLSVNALNVKLYREGLEYRTEYAKNGFPIETTETRDYAEFVKEVADFVSRYEVREQDGSNKTTDDPPLEAEEPCVRRIEISN